MRNLEKGQHIFIAFQDGKAVLDSQLRPRIYTSLENAEKWTPTVDKGKIEYVEYAPTLTPPNEPLTLEQLREMDGEPVWIKRLKGLSVCDTGWAVVDVCPNQIRVWWFGSEVEDEPSEKDYGETWLAYRRPPEGEGDI